MTVRSLLARLAFVLVALPLATGGDVKAQPATRTLRTTMISDIRGLMPGMSPDVYTGTVLQQVYEGLVASRTDGTVAPMLAESVEAAADGLSYSFTLRPGVTFHNGQPLTAETVVWTWRQFLDPKRNWICRLSFDGSRGGIKITEVVAEGERKVVFRLAAPAPSFLPMMARPDCDAGIAHPDSVDAEGQWSKAIGTGPFRLGEWRRGQFVDLARFDTYSPRSEATDGYAGRKEARVERIRFLIIPDPNAAKAGLVNGDVDLILFLEASFATEIRANPRLKLGSSALAAINTVLMQTRDPVLSDVRIRQAVNAAIDYDGLAEAISEGFVKASTSPIPDTSRYFGPVERQGHVFDQAKARRLLKEAGYRGQVLKITTPPRGTMFDMAIAIQAMLREVGLNVEVEAMEFGTMLAKNLRGDFQMMVWLYTPYLEPMFLFERFMGDKGQSPDRIWEDREALAVLQRLLATSDPAARQPLFDELHRRFIADSPMIVWASRWTIAAHTAALEGDFSWPGQRVRLWNAGFKP
jgi:peptide/nickel transport system substrate-binding protein